MKNIFIIIPAYNEEKKIAEVIKNLLNNNYQNIVIVDDSSKDKTSKIAGRFPVFLLRHNLNRGQGASLQTGTEFALNQGAEIIVHFDGDGQFLSDEIQSAINPILNNEVDIVFGSRFLNHSEQKEISADTKNKMPFLKKNIILPVARIINYFLTGVKLTDAHCGFRAMNKFTAEKINITQDRMSHNTEIVAQIKKYNLKFKEVPITVIYNEFGQNVGGGFRILKELLIGKFLIKDK